MKEYFLLLLTVTALSFDSRAQLNITAGNIYGETFNFIGSADNATLPTGWMLQRSITINVVSQYSPFTDGGLSAGGGASVPIQEAPCNFGAGTNNLGSDRSIGGVSRGSITVGVDLFNNGTTGISALNVNYAIEKYKAGTLAYTAQLYYSTDGFNWTSAGPFFSTTFPADLNGNGYPNAPGSTTNVSGTLSVYIAPSSHLYLAWNFTTNTQDALSQISRYQGLGIDDVQLATVASVVPTLTSPTVTSVSNNSATLGATISSGNPAPITARGTVWGTSTNPTGNALAEGGTMSGAFSHNRTGLTPNTAYFFRGYATNIAGTAYSPNGTFTTLSNAPISQTASNITTSGFRANWLAPSGNGPVSISYTVEVATDLNFTNVIQTFTGLTSLFQDISGLTVNTQYYYRVKAVNVSGNSAWSVVQTPQTANYPSCSGTPATSTINSSGGTSFCSGAVSSILSLSQDYSQLLNISYLWKQSSDNIGYVNATGTNNAATYTLPALTQSTYYKCTVTCSNGGASSTTVALLISVNGVEISVQGNNIDIADGDVTPSTTDNTDFGTVGTNSPVTKQFLIQNTGTLNLSISNISFTGTNSSDFSLVNPPSFPLTITPAGSQTITVQLLAPASGLRSATLNVANNDCNEASYDFALRGTAVSQDINVQGNSITILDGDATPSATDNTNFGNVPMNTSVTKQFVIQNVGVANLSVTGITFTGANNSEFALVSPPAFPITITASGSQTITVQFLPTGSGARNATINIASNDPDEANYDFALTGTGLPPEIDLQGNGISITDGDVTPNTTDNTDFGDATVNTPLTKQFVIQNSGTANLSVTNITFTGTNNTEFTLVTPPAFPFTVAPSGSQTITVQFLPTVSGLRFATINIANNDPDESNYDFALQGGTADAGAALNFDGTNDYVALPGSLVTSASGGTAITIEYWFKGSSLQSAVCMQDANGYVVAGWNGTHIISTDGGTANGISVGAAATDGNWHHVAMTWQKNTVNGFNSYLDGQLVAQRDAANVNLPALTTGGYLGAFNGNSEFMNGSLDEVRIWNRALCQVEIQHDMNCELSGTPAGLVAYYKFNSGFALTSNTSITTLSDAGPVGYNGTLANFTLTGSASNWIAQGGVTTGNSCSTLALAEINVKGNSVDITDGDATPSASDNTGFGNVLLGATLTKNFLIENTGAADLFISNISFSGTNSSEFTLVNPPSFPTTITSGSSTTITVQFLPTGAGIRSSTINIANDDCNEGTYDFKLQGTGLVPEINVQGNGISIPDGQTSTSTSNNTDYGTIAISTTLSKQFIIQNTGTGNLSVTAISFTGTNSNEFTIVSPTVFPFTVAPSGSQTITVQFQPAGTGSKNAIINISNSDADESNYDFALQGTSENPGAALSFDGTNDKATVASGINLSNTSFTVEFWAKRGSANTNDFIVSTGSTGALNQMLHIGFRNTNAFTFAFWSNDLDVTGYSDNVWHHWACVYVAGTSSGNDRFIYRDGILLGSDRSSSNFLGTGAFTIGDLPASAGSQFDGSVDELRVWNVARSQPEIQNFMNCEISGAQCGLIANYHFNQGLNNTNNAGLTTLTDVSGNGKNGTLNNFALTGATSNWVYPGGVTSGTSCTYPEINVQGNTTDITDGDNTPTTTDNTDFGNVVVSVPSTKQFVIQNTGAGNLVVTGINLIGTNSSEFTFVTPPSFPFNILSGGTQTITIQVLATATGARTATVNILNSDCDELTYDFSLTANGTTPEIEVLGNSVTITDGDLTPGTADNTDLGDVAINDSITRQFEIRNTGTADLTITGITFTGTNSSEFTLVNPPSFPFIVGPSGSQTISVQLLPLASGTRTTKINITNNDLNESTYDFALKGGTPDAGAALSFDGVNDKVTVASGINLSNKSFTVEFWAKRNTSGTDDFIISNGTTGATNQMLHIGFRSNNAFAFAFWSNDLNISGYSDNAWHHWACVYVAGTASGNNRFIYRDGVLIANDRSSSNLLGTGAFTIGDLSVASNSSFDGNIDEVRVWSVALTQPQIQYYMNCEVTGPLCNLVASYHFNQGFALNDNLSETTLNDASGNGNNGTLNNFALTGTGSSNWISAGAVVSGTACNLPDINLQGNGVSIIDGDNTPSLADSTDFGSVQNYLPQTRQYTIQNTGAGNLFVTNITLTGNAHFTLVNPPSLPLTIIPSSSQIITVKYSPVSNITETVTLNISSNDCDEATYDFAIKGSGLLPEIIVKGNGVSILDGDLIPVASDNTDFGSVVINDTSLKKFVVQNTGPGYLSISSISFTGINAADYSVVSPTVFPMVIPDSSSDTITIQLIPSAAGIRLATINIHSNDADEGNYDFALEGGIPETGAALNFDGVDDYVGFPYAIDLSKSFTIEFWARRNGSGTNDYAFNCGTSTVTNKYLYIGYRANGNFTFAFFNNDLNVGGLSDNLWHHWACVYKDSTAGNNRFIYRDGILVASDHSDSSFLGVGIYYLGDGYISNSQYSGDLDELRIWNEARSATEIQHYMNCEINDPICKLARNYHFNESFAFSNNIDVSGSIFLTDASGNNKYGLANNFSLVGASSNWIKPGGVASGVSCTPPFIAVTGNGITIQDGDNTSDTLDNTDFGSIGIGSITRQFVILNPDSVDLLINSITFTGTGSSDYALVSPPAVPDTLHPDSSKVITVKFAPSSGGISTSMLNINYNCFSNYNFSLKGTGTSEPGAALNFDGDDDHLTIGTSSRNLGVDTGSFTIEFWAKRHSSGSDDYIFSAAYNNVTNNKLLIGFRANDDFVFSFYNNDLVASGLSDNLWHHWACVYQSGGGPGNNRFIYRDGILVAEDRSASAFLGSSSTVQVGGDIAAPLRNFDGDLDEFRIWSTARSGADIQSFRNCEINAPQCHLEANYHFNEGQTLSFNSYYITPFDASGNNNYTTLDGFARQGQTSNWTSPGSIVSGTTCTVTQIPEINVQANGINLSDGFTIINSFFNTDFGIVRVGDSATRDFVIQNTGAADLIVSAVNFTGSTGADFSLENPPVFPFTLASDSSDTITIRFSPTGGGIRSATLNIESSDCSESIYNINLQGQVEGAALNFDGNDDRVIVSSGFDLYAKSFTIEFWAKRGSEGTDDYLISNGDYFPFMNTNQLLIIGWRANNDFTFGFYGDDLNVSGLSDTLWHHWACSYESGTTSGDNRFIYRDGVLVGSNRSDLGLFSYGPFTMGEVTGLPGSQFGGTLDEVRVWDHQLQSCEILHHMNCEIDTATGLMASYHFNQGAAGVGYYDNIYDNSGNSNTGIPSNFGFCCETSNWVLPGGVVSGNICPSTQPETPEINVTGNHVTIADGESVTSSTNNTDFDDNTLHTFTIQNTGLEILFVSGIIISGVNASDFIPVDFPAFPISILPGDSQIIAIQFSPTAEGDRFATLTISSDDCSKQKYDFSLHGAIPITVEGNNLLIVNGDTTPDFGDNTYFGASQLNVAISRDFVIKNSGSDVLLISGITIDSSSDFIVADPSVFPLNILPGDSQIITIQFLPTGTDTSYATLNIFSDNVFDSLYRFLLKGIIGTPASALDFDGMDDAIDFLPSTPIESGAPGEYTVEAWIYLKAYTGDYQRIYGNELNGDAGISMEIDPNGFISTYHPNVGNVISSTQLPLNTWTHVAFVQDANELKLYVNGNFVQVLLTVPNLHVETYNIPEVSFNGRMDELRIWNVALSQAAIQGTMNCELGGPQCELTAYYKFNQGFAGDYNSNVTILQDASGNGRNGTLHDFNLTGPTSNWITPGAVTTGTSCLITYTPEIDVRGNNVSIANGSTVSDTANLTNFGNVNIDSVVTHQFVIQNSGHEDLSISGMSISTAIFGTNANQFSVTSPSSYPFTVAAGDSQVITVQFAPTELFYAFAQLNIFSNDCDEGSYSFWISAFAHCDSVKFYYPDADHDGYGATYTSFGFCEDPGPGYSLIGDDCDDNDSTVWQSAVLYLDSDGDGYDAGAAYFCYGSTLPQGYSLTTLGSDCNDNDSTMWHMVLAYTDQDEDGYGLFQNFVCAGNSAPQGYSFTSAGFDCNDNDSSKYISSLVYYDGDGDGHGNNIFLCHGNILPPGYSLTPLPFDCDDNDSTKWNQVGAYVDADGDGYGDGNLVVLCIGDSLPEGYANLVAVDCNDSVASIHPNATEVCNNGVDDNCNGQTDENCNASYTYYADADHDTYGDPLNSVSSNNSTPPSGYVTDHTDCDDSKVSVHPGAAEICNNLDDNCDSQIDEGVTFTTYYVDADHDGYGAGTGASFCSNPGAGYSINNSDCNDANAAIHPNAVEIFNNLDDNCNGFIDEISCPKPLNPTVTNITATTVTLSWTPGMATPVGYKVGWKMKSGSGPSSLKITNGATTSVTITGLVPNTAYKWGVNESCTSTKKSRFALGSFTTLSAKESEDLISPVSELKIYPNPNNGAFVIELSIPDSLVNSVVIQIYNTIGQLVQEEKTESVDGMVKQEIHLADEATAGLYLIRVISGDELYAKQLIIQK